MNRILSSSFLVSCVCHVAAATAVPQQQCLSTTTTSSRHEFKHFSLIFCFVSIFHLFLLIAKRGGGVNVILSGGLTLYL
jgi:hypothetical protein